MAISRVNTTSQSNANITASVGIPTVTAGNTIVVCIADGEFNSGAAPSISDNAGNTYTLQVSAFANTLGNPARRNARIWTVFNANGGASSLFIIWPTSCSSRITVVEYSGVKLTSPLERVRAGNDFALGGGGVNGPIIIGAIRWDVANSLLVGVNASNSTNTNAINGAASPTPPWNLIATNLASYGGSVCDKIPTYANPVPPNTEETQGLTGNGTAPQCFATIVLLKADLTLLCTETIDTDDTDTNDVEKPMNMDTMTLSDFVDALLNGNERFRSNVETITHTDAIFFLRTYVRTLQETLLLLDTITFMNQFVRTMGMETIRVQDWVGVKKTNSTHWSS